MNDPPTALVGFRKMAIQETGIEFAYPSLVRLSLLKMRRFSQIFTCSKWHLLLVHEPFYVVRSHSCKLTGRTSLKSGLQDLLSVPAIPDKSTNSARLSSKPVASGFLVRPRARREGFTQSCSRFFQGGRNILPASTNKEKKRIAMELKK